MKKVILLGIISELLLLVLSQHASHKFKYTPQNYFIYKYSIEATSIFNGTSKNESTLFIDADVTLNFLTPCDGLLAISDIILSETAPGDNEKIPTSTNSQLFSDMMREHTLRFAFKDGIIYEICPDDDEENWPINFKRGILSMIHNSMKRFDLDYSGEEEDVRGICSTDYKVIGAKETSLLIEKTKNLETCRERIKVNSIVQFTPVSNFHSRTRNEDILKSSSRCVMSIDENIYSDIACEENYVLEPFSNNAAGASTRVIQKLTLKERGEKKLSEENKIWRRTNLKFDHSIPKQPTIGDLRITRDLIKKLCKESQHDSQSDFSDFFGKEHVLEALPYINTAGSLGLMKDIILANTLSEDTLDNWMMSIAFISNPDIDMIEAAYTILKENPYSSKTNIFLSIASLTHTFCSQNSHCEKRASIYSIIQHFEHNFLELLEDDTANREVQDQVIVTLKALSSIGVISENFAAELFKVVNYSNLDVGIRVAALETFRRLPCEKHRSYFESIFEDQEQDSEVRISAYLQVMRCPSYLLIRTIAYNLRNEEVNQVGSFVWSHLHNIIKSANPLKVEIQSLLSEEDLIEKFSGDIRKFSHNREFSLYFDEYNFGGNYESNVLFSPSSYIPRSAMVNLTVDLFGKYVNLLEVQGRVEGFEHYLESFFGPGGRANVIKEKMEEYKMRWIREASEKNLVENNVQDIADAVDNLEKNPKVALGIKIFGNDLKYATFKGDGEIKQAMEYFNILTYLKQILSGKEIMYKKATMFLDSNYVVPSGAGLPLFISALGTASVNIKLFGSLKAAGFSQKKELDLVANFEPTAAIDISAEMSLSAFYESTGIKLKTDMQSSIAVKGNIEIKGAKLVSVKFSLPKKNVKIFGARSELLVRQKNIENPQTGLQKTSVSNSMCSWPAISEAIGLTLCTDYSYRNSTSIFNAPDFILAGPANFQIYVQKSDPTANIYLFEYKWKQAHDLDVISLTFDTPGSEVNRLMHSNFTMSKDGHNLTMLMQSSSGIILARGVIKNTEEQKVFQMVLDINDKKHFDTSVGYDRFKKVNGYIYKPKLYIGVNGERVVELKGTVDLISKKDISQYTLDLKFHTKRLTSKLFGYISKTDSSIGTDLHMDYKFINTKEQRVSLKFSVANRSRKNLAVILGTCDIQSTAYPNYNFFSNVTFQKSGSHLEFNVDLIQNPLPLNDTNSDFESLKFDFKFSHKAFTDNKQTIKAISTVKRKSSNLDMKGIFFYETANFDVNMECAVNYGDNKQAAVTIFWSHPRTTMEEIKAHLNITVPTFTPMILKVEISEMQNRDYRLDISGTWFSGHSAHAVGIYQDSSTALASNHHLKVFIKSPSFKDVNADLLFYRDNEQLKIDVEAIHEENDYQLFINHNSTSDEEMHTNVKIKCGTRLYTLNTAINRGEHFKISTELHIDQLRDVEFSVWIFNEETQKALGFDINWDANRDPSQKLLVAANLSTAGDLNYNADLIVSYPGRTIIGNYEFLFEKGHIDMLASISWDDGKSLAINFNAKYRYENEIFFGMSFGLNTPVDSWKNIKLSGVFEHIGNKYGLNGALTWNPRQKVAIDLYGDYTSKGPNFDCKYSCSVESTLSNIPYVNTTVQHSQNSTDYNTIVFFMYNPDFLIDVESMWKLQTNEIFSNLTGTVKTVTPFKGFKKGVFVSKIFYTANKYLRGAAEIDLDHNKILIDMEGKFKKLIDSMFVANITTPDETYECKFKLSKKDRHFIALLSYPTGQLGTEVLVVLNDLTDFNVKLLLATPVEFLQKILIIAKLQPKEADFRIGWNSLLLGFSGRWYYSNIIDFLYTYRIYTPIKDFEDNGIVAKLIFKEGLDFEMSCKLSLFKDVLSMSNTLRIVTPYKRFKTLKSDFNLQFIQNQRYMFHLNLRYENNSVPIIAGVLAEYNVHRQNIDERIYNVTLDLDTPFKAFPKLKLFGAFETEENFYRTKLLFTTNSSDISLDATTETDDGWMGLTSDFHVKSPIINVPECQIRLTKLSSYSNNYVEIHLKVPDKLKSEVYFRTSWLFKALNQFRSTLELETPFTGLESTKVGLDFLSRNERTTLWAYFHVHPIASEFNSTFENDLLTSAALIKFGDKIFPVNINCKILASSQNRRELNGTLLLRDKVFKINGNANLIRSLPVKVLITFTPQDNSTPLTFQYNLETTLKGYGLVGALSYANRLTRFSGNATVDDTFNWEVNLKVDPPDSMLKVAARVIAKSIRNGASLDTEITTNMPNNELSKFGINYRLEEIYKYASDNTNDQFFEQNFLARYEFVEEFYNEFKIVHNEIIGLISGETEFTIQDQTMKYLHKYLVKGFDSIRVEVDAGNELDEIQRYLNCRYVSSIEAAWRLFEFKMFDRSHSVTLLPVHLPGFRDVFYDEQADVDEVQAALDKPSKLEAFFVLNAESPDARDLLYCQIPEYYIWNARGARWNKRRASSKMIGTVYEVSPNDPQIEKFYLRILLLHVRGPTSFENLRTVDNDLCPDFKTACHRRNLLRNGVEYNRCMAEALLRKLPCRLRRLFATICAIVIDDDLAQIPRLWLKYKLDMIEDYRHRGLNYGDSIMRCFQVVDGILASSRQGTTLAQLGVILDADDLRIIAAEERTAVGLEVDDLDREVGGQGPVTDYGLARLNLDQKTIFIQIVHAIRFLKRSGHLPLDTYLDLMDVPTSVLGDRSQLKSNVFYLDGPGGTGKTYLFNTILHYVQSTMRMTTVAVAWTGIAANLLFGGKTVHKTFRLPLNLTDRTVAGWPLEHGTSRYLRNVALVVWDEAPMTPRLAVDAIDRYFRELMDNRDLPFGGKCFVFGGDFRQILPVVKGDGDNIGRITDACLKSSHLWREDTILKSNGYFLIGYVEGRANVDLTYVYLEDMCLRGIGNYKNQQFNSSSQVELFYRNPEQAFKELTTGGDLKIDDLWEAGTNASLMLPSKNNLSFEGYLKIPNDYRETHSLFGKLIYGTGLSFIDYLVKYRSTYPTRKYGLWGEDELYYRILLRDI
ncbi:unnamed protein product [Ceutorhynchus assimilis]|uniref:ATP-dependent DNA helicase n=1 Tax=Ceutorhynchus assimilis TaxID=467358 RepID=A0A9N9QIT3_9CUCU|nr:unnamed protein product [Ceutorhynchus assimilis]